MNPVGFTGKLFDRYLASGWYRMGSRMFTCRYNFYDWGFLSTVWTRLPLVNHTFPKRTAKLVRKNDNLFRHEVHRARAREAEEAVFNLYSASKSYDLHHSAESYILHDRDAPFDTWQISVYLENELIAFCYFDRGQESVQSICGFFNPAYKAYSLGLYTLALEVEYCKAEGLNYHYAGYIVPGNDIFEYKRKVGKLEAFDDVDRVWYPIVNMDEELLPDAMQRKAMYNYEMLYHDLDVTYSMRIRPQYFIGISQQDLQWLRREQLPFCITDDRANRRPYWACHFYSYNRKSYISLLCASHSYEQDSLRKLGATKRDQDLRHKHPHLPIGMAVRLLHMSKSPYTLEDLEVVWQAVEAANAEAIGEQEL